MQALLAAQGFQPPDPWVDYARRHHFRRVPARRLHACPDCGTRPEQTLAQYVYFSHLARLRECGACGLVYSDLRLPGELTHGHFETAYKDDAYFSGQRAGVFRQLARIVADEAAAGARVLDVGAATGRLMAAVRQDRPDLAIAVSDISDAACRAAERNGFRALRSDLAGLDRVEEVFDIVIMSDVLYLEASVRRLWTVLPRLVAPGGLLILRIPNRLPWIRLHGRLQKLAPARAAAMDRVPLFNPEHLFVFPPRFLRARLQQIGFSQVTTRPACSLRGEGARGVVGAFVDAGAWGAYRLLPGRPVISPSLILTARRAPA